MQRLVHGRAHALGLGSFHLVPLAQAREQALANRRVARAGGDPRAASRRADGMPTFEEAAAKVVATAALPKRPVPTEHRRALPHAEVASAVAAVRSSTAWTGVKLAFEFLVLTAAWSAEVRLATWEEMDMDTLVWVIPASRMKTAREHRVPLCSRAVEVLQQARRLRVDKRGEPRTEEQDAATSRNWPRSVDRSTATLPGQPLQLQ